MTDDIAAFIKARLDEDEAGAKAATDGPWIAEFSGGTGHCVIPADAQSTREHVARTQLYDAVGDAVHIARHDPARVLGEVAALREVVECHEPWTAANGDVICGRCGREHIDGRPGGHFPCQTLRCLAAIWSDHPEYKAEWRP